MPRKKAKKPAKPFFTTLPDVARQLSDPAALPIAEDFRSVAAVPDYRDFVEREEDEFIAARPHLREMRDLCGRDGLVLMYEFIRANHRKDALSEGDFLAWLNEKGNDGRSLINLLRAKNLFSENLSKGAFCPAELYVFYLNHRSSQMDQLRATFATIDGRNRIVQLRDSCDELAELLRTIALPLSRCGTSSQPIEEHPMPDEMRRLILRAAGDEKRLNRGWLQWFAEWVNEAAYRLKPAKSAIREKESRFQLDWYELAMKKTSGRNPLWEECRRIFLLAFPSDRDRYVDLAAFRKVAVRRVNAKKRPANVLPMGSRRSRRRREL